MSLRRAQLTFHTIDGDDIFDSIVGIPDYQCTMLTESYRDNMAMSNGETEEAPESTPDDEIGGYGAKVVDSKKPFNEDEEDPGVELAGFHATPNAEQGAKPAEPATNQAGEYDEKTWSKGGAKRPRSTTNPVQAVDVSKMTKRECEEYYARYFGRFVEPLDFISFPNVSDMCAESQHGTFESYLRNTTFTVQVWYVIRRHNPSYVKENC